MHICHAHQVGAILSVEVVQIGDVLEVVGVNAAVLHRGVGLDVVGKLHDLQVDSLLRQQFLHHGQDLGVGSGRGAHLQGGALQGAGLGGGGRGVSVCGGGVGGTKGGGIPKSEHKKTPLNPNSRTRAFRLRGTTLLHPCLTTGALWSTGILPRADGRSRRGLCLWQSAAPLRDHLPQSLPYPFPPFRALCAVSLWLLFSSSRLRGVIQFRLGCT